MHCSVPQVDILGILGALQQRQAPTQAIGSERNAPRLWLPLPTERVPPHIRAGQIVSGVMVPKPFPHQNLAFLDESRTEFPLQRNLRPRCGAIPCTDEQCQIAPLKLRCFFGSCDRKGILNCFTPGFFPETGLWKAPRFAPI